MDSAPTLLIQLAAAVGSSLIAYRLKTSGLSAKYRMFFLYMAFRGPCIAVGLALAAYNPKSTEYLRYFLFWQSAAWFFNIFSVLEIFRLVLERHKGLYSLGRWATLGSLLVAAAVSSILMVIKVGPLHPQGSQWAIPMAFAVERVVDVGLAVFLLLMLLFLVVYAVPLNRNILVHVAVYSAFFLSGALGTILRALYGLKSAPVTDVLSLVGPCFCVVAWMLLLKPVGEKALVRLPWFGAESETRLLAQLDALNATLLRAARK